MVSLRCRLPLPTKLGPPGRGTAARVDREEVSVKRSVPHCVHGQAVSSVESFPVCVTAEVRRLVHQRGTTMPVRDSGGRVAEAPRA